MDCETSSGRNLTRRRPRHGLLALCPGVIAQRRVAIHQLDGFSGETDKIFQNCAHFHPKKAVPEDFFPDGSSYDRQAVQLECEACAITVGSDDPDGGGDDDAMGSDE